MTDIYFIGLLCQAQVDKSNEHILRKMTNYRFRTNYGPFLMNFGYADIFNKNIYNAFEYSLSPTIYLTKIF